MNRRFWRLAALLLFILAITATARACPNCKEGLAGDPQTAGLVRGYFWSILFMMSMPFLVLGGLVSYFYLLVRQARRAQAVEGDESIASQPMAASSVG